MGQPAYRKKPRLSGPLHDEPHRNLSSAHAARLLADSAFAAKPSLPNTPEAHFSEPYPELRGARGSVAREDVMDVERVAGGRSMDEGSAAEGPLSLMSDDLLIRILQLSRPTAWDLCRLSCVSRAWRRACSHPAFWQKLRIGTGSMRPGVENLAPRCAHLTELFIDDPRCDLHILHPILVACGDSLRRVVIECDSAAELAAEDDATAPAAAAEGFAAAEEEDAFAGADDLETVMDADDADEAAVASGAAAGEHPSAAEAFAVAPAAAAVPADAMVPHTEGDTSSTANEASVCSVLWLISLYCRNVETLELLSDDGRIETLEPTVPAGNHAAGGQVAASAACGNLESRIMWYLTSGFRNIRYFASLARGSVTRQSVYLMVIAWRALECLRLNISSLETDDLVTLRKCYGLRALELVGGRLRPLSDAAMAVMQRASEADGEDSVVFHRQLELLVLTGVEFDPQTVASLAALCPNLRRIMVSGGLCEACHQGGGGSGGSSGPAGCCGGAAAKCVKWQVQMLQFALSQVRVCLHQ